MDLFTALRGRRSVRDYAPEPVPDATVRQLLDAAVQAPSAMNTQSWAFVVVQDPALLQRISDRAKALLLAEPADPVHCGRYRDQLADPAFHVFYNASTLIVVCAPVDHRYAAADCWLAAQNLMLAAHALGLGSCCIGLATAVLNQPDVKAELGIGAELMGVAPLIVGWPAQSLVPVPRAAPRVVSWLRG